MNVIRVVDPHGVRPLHVVMVCLLAATVAGSCLLTSGPFARMEGSKDWAEESPLRAIVNVLNLNYTQTTALGIEIKSLVFGLGAAVAAMAWGLSLLFRSTTDDDVSPEHSIAIPSAGDLPYDTAGPRHLSPLAAAQALMVAYVAWSFLSTLWSTAADFAFGGSVLLGVGVVWALALGRGLNRSTAVAGSYALLAICAMTAVLAIAYYGERNPTRRASYPIGNPLFLAACLIPGILLSAGLLWASIRALTRRAVFLIAAVLCVIAAGLMIWTVVLTSSRSGMIAIGAGLLAMVFFAVGRRGKLPVGAGAMVLVFAALLYLWPHFSAPSNTGRDASLRLRAYAWWYAIDLIANAKFTGHGQGAYTQYGDASAMKDVLDDPQALGARIAHAHNEWLEVGADLGAVGVTLVLGSLGLTLWAAMGALRKLTHPFLRWTLAALLASLVALVIEETADVGLRIAGVPTVFYTVLGLVWALSAIPAVSRRRWFQVGPALCRCAGGGGLLVGTLVLWATTSDFRGARAYQEVSTALQRRDFDRAAVLAKRATEHRLSPQRRLEALERQCSTHLYIAREYQLSSLDRYAKSATTDPPNAHLLSLGHADRGKSEKHIDRARQSLQALLRRSPSYFGSGWLEYRLYQLRNAYARHDGDSDAAAKAMTGAAAALERELKRRPFEAAVALTYVDIAGDQVSLADVFDIIARPLRHAAISPEYTDYVTRLSQRPDFDEQFAAVWEGIVPQSPDAAPQDPQAPEKLRLAALIRFMRSEYVRALETVQMANSLYPLSGRSGEIGVAAGMAEAAEYGFIVDPGRWKAAVRYAGTALELLPNSTPGRELASRLRARMVIYHLAGDDESTARSLLEQLQPDSPASAIDAELGRHYTLLGNDLIQRSYGALPDGFSRWVRRALELRPQDELAWRLNAQIAFNQGRLGETVASLRRALEFGANPGVVYGFALFALETHAQSAEFRALEQELREILRPAEARGGAVESRLKPAPRESDGKRPPPTQVGGKS